MKIKVSNGMEIIKLVLPVYFSNLFYKSENIIWRYFENFQKLIDNSNNILYNGKNQR